MPGEIRFLLGYGERLTAPVKAPPGGRPTDAPYTYAEASERLAPRVEQMSRELADLPGLACPGGEAVGIITMHPQAIAKSYSPRQLLTQYGLRQVGSRPTSVTPERWTRKEVPRESHTTDLYVAGDRESFSQWADDLSSAGEGKTVVHEVIQRLENVRAPRTEDRLRVPRDGRSSELLLEVVLHARDSQADAYIVETFVAFANSLGIHADTDRRLFAGGLCFLPVEADVQSLDELAQFAFLRVARPMPKMREIGPIERAVPRPELPQSPIPNDPPISDLRVAIFDGGLPDQTPLRKWAALHEFPDLAAPVPEMECHGHDVTSSVLFGSLVPGEPAPRPYCYVDHFRVLDTQSESDPLELYDVLRRIQGALSDRRYEFFNLSLGPVTPIEDDEVHPWTALLDEHLSDGHAIATLAVGNTGHLPAAEEARVQVPGDSVNAFAVGAADSSLGGWSRASYSSIGPGRSPGVVKPDVVEFGGCAREPFMVFDPGAAPKVASTQGTSFAAPSALRRAVGLRVHFGDRLSPLAIKALLIHTAQAAGHDRNEVGWGKIRDELSDIVVCPDGTVRVVYQGELTPSQYLRAAIPLPTDTTTGYITIRTTFTYATPVDPEDPGNYTRSGLDVTFRPHARRFSSDTAVDPEPKPFFKRSSFDPEKQLRTDAQKWETVLHRERRFRANSLYNPVFDIHYNARAGGSITNSAEKIRYALVVDVSSKRDDLYDVVLRTYAGRLEALRPVVQVPVSIEPS